MYTCSILAVTVSRHTLGGILLCRVTTPVFCNVWSTQTKEVILTSLTMASYGYLTWEWRVGIRSYAYPLLFATFYKVLEILGLDNRLLLVNIYHVSGLFL